MADLSRLRGRIFLAIGRAGMDLYADPPGTRIEAAGQLFDLCAVVRGHCAGLPFEIGKRTLRKVAFIAFDIGIGRSRRRHDEAARDPLRAAVIANLKNIRLRREGGQHCADQTCRNRRTLENHRHPPFDASPMASQNDKRVTVPGQSRRSLARAWT